MSGCGTWPTSILKRSISVLWDKADVPGPLADPSMTPGDIWRDVLRLTAQTSARREEHYAVLFGHSLLDNITPKGDRQCLKHIGLKGFEALFVIKMPRLHFGGSKRLSVSNRYSSYWTPKVISVTRR